MSLERIKTLYCIAVIVIAIVLDCTGGILGWATAVVMLTGALPVWEAMRRCFRRQFWKDVENIVTASGGQPAKARPSDQE